MSLTDQLKIIREKLLANRAKPGTVAFLDLRIREAASAPDSPSAPRVPEMMIIRHLTRRTDVRDTDIELDLLNLLPEENSRPRVELEETERQPRPHSFYRKKKA